VIACTDGGIAPIIAWPVCPLRQISSWRLRRLGIAYPVH
jgi:hypothetical protein